MINKEKNLIVTPHNIISREVTGEDLEVILKISKEMLEYCRKPMGIFKSILALAHAQVENKSPLRFFVTTEGEIIVNPEIRRHTQSCVKSKEGCCSFPDRYSIEVDRWNKCEVDYYLLQEDGTLSELIYEKLSGVRAKMFQHEIQHFEGRYIYE